MMHITKDYMLEYLTKTIPDNAEIGYVSLTYWDDDGCHNLDMDYDCIEKEGEAE